MNSERFLVVDQLWPDFGEIGAAVPGLTDAVSFALGS